MRIPRKSLAAATNIMSPNTKQQKSCLTRDVAGSIRKYMKSLCREDETEVIKMALKRLGLKLLTATNKNKNVEKSMTAFPIRKLVSDTWHQNCTPSTWISNPTKPKQSQKPKTEEGLPFADTVTKIVQHNITHYMNHWLIMNEIIKMSELTYLREYPQTPVSRGIFALMSF